MKFKNYKRLAAAALATIMTVSLAACGTPGESKSSGDSAKTEASTDVERPEAVSEEDWAAMQKEPVFGTEINYLFNGGACVSAKYLAEVNGYYEEYGINATYVEGESVADLKGKTIAIHDGIGNSDQNICYRLLDEYGLDPTTEVEFLDIADSAATVAAMENGEVDASIFSDYFVLANYPDDMRMICSITYSPEFQDEPCCVTAMNNKFIKENPVHAKYVTMAIKRAGEYARLNSSDAVQKMYDTDKMTGEQEDQMVFWDSLHFGLSDAFTEKALREIAEDYLRLGIIENKDLTVDKIMNMAWTPLCPDEEIEGLTVGDPVEVEGSTIPVKQNENPVTREGFGVTAQ